MKYVSFKFTYMAKITEFSFLNNGSIQRITSFPVPLLLHETFKSNVSLQSVFPPTTDTSTIQLGNTLISFPGHAQRYM